MVPEAVKTGAAGRTNFLVMELLYMVHLKIKLLWYLLIHLPPGLYLIGIFVVSKPTALQLDKQDVLSIGGLQLQSH